MNISSRMFHKIVDKRFHLLLGFFVLGILISGCADVNRLREAQDAFNQAAAAENALRFDALSLPRAGSAPSSESAWSASRNGYASVLLSLDRLDKKDQDRLRADGLWGTALTLKALSQWRLGLFSKALATAEEARDTGGDQIYPRDSALLAALPGLIKTDQGYNKIVGKQDLTSAEKTRLLAEVEALLVGEHGAVADIQRGRDLVDAKHPIQIYLLQAQLAAYRNFMVAEDRLNNHATVPDDHPALARANEQLKVLNALLGKPQPGTEGAKLVEYWIRVGALQIP